MNSDISPRTLPEPIASMRVGRLTYRDSRDGSRFHIEVWCDRNKSGILTKCGTAIFTGKLRNDWNFRLEIHDGMLVSCQGARKTGQISVQNGKSFTIMFQTSFFKACKACLSIPGATWVLTYPKTLMTDGLRQTDKCVLANKGDAQIRLWTFPEEKYTSFGAPPYITAPLSTVRPVFDLAAVDHLRDPFSEAWALLASGLLGYALFTGGG